MRACACLLGDSKVTAVTFQQAPTPPLPPYIQFRYMCGVAISDDYNWGSRPPTGDTRIYPYRPIPSNSFSCTGCRKSYQTVSYVLSVSVQVPMKPCFPARPVPKLIPLSQSSPVRTLSPSLTVILRSESDSHSAKQSTKRFAGPGGPDTGPDTGPDRSSHTHTQREIRQSA